MAYVKDCVDKNFFLCFTHIEEDGAFSCHLYNRITKITYLGSDKIKDTSKNTNHFEYELIIPITEMLYEEIMNKSFVEILYLGIHDVLKKYNLVEYSI